LNDCDAAGAKRGKEGKTRREAVWGETPIIRFCLSDSLPNRANRGVGTTGEQTSVGRM